MEKIVELSDIEISREKMDRYNLAITHNSDKNTHTVYTYLLERLQVDQEKDANYIPEQEGNYRETLRKNNDTLLLLGWEPKDRLNEYIKKL